MAISVQVPKDLSGIKTKVALNLTKRQIICFSGAAVAGIPLYFLTKGLIGTSAASLLMMGAMLPFFFFAMYEKNGQPLEVYLGHFIQASFIRPKIRIYQTDNYYAALIRQAAAERQIQEVENSVQLYKEAVPERKEGDHPAGASVQRGPEKSKGDYKERAER